MLGSVCLGLIFLLILCIELYLWTGIWSYRLLICSGILANEVPFDCGSVAVFTAFMDEQNKDLSKKKTLIFKRYKSCF